MIQTSPTTACTPATSLPTQKIVGILTLGCKVNTYDSEAMEELLVENGYTVKDFSEYADVYIINTCTVTNLSDRKSRQMIRKAINLNPDAVVVATGCYAQVSPEEIEKIEGINIVLGTKNRNKIVEIIENYTKDMGIVNYVSNIMEEKTFEKLVINKISHQTRAYLKIQEGCLQFCTYCIIPYSRGPIRSRNASDILSEVQLLAKNDFKEIVLAGIHVASYGKDLDNINLLDVLEMVNKVEGIERIRFSSIEPNIVTDEFLERISKLPKICDHFHLSLQSGCDKTLKKMNRKYETSQYREAVRKLRAIYKNVGITTDIIVGFPGETEEDFEESLKFVEELELSKIHVFPFSPKKGTKAAEFSDQVPNDVKKIRSERMRALGDKLEALFIQKNIGQTLNCLYEKNIGNNVYEGYSTNYIKVQTVSQENLINQIKLTNSIEKNNDVMITVL